MLNFVGKGPSLLSTFCTVLVFVRGGVWFTNPQVFFLLENVTSWSTFTLQKGQLGLLVSGPLLWRT